MQKKIKTLFLNYWMVIVGVITGAIAGYFYWQQVGCVSGSCAITSSPINSTLYGALMGGSFVNILKK